VLIINKPSRYTAVFTSHEGRQVLIARTGSVAQGKKLLALGGRRCENDVSSTVRRIARCLNGGDMTRRSRPHSARRQPAATHATPAPEVIAFTAAVLLQMDHAANLVVAFFRSVGLMGPTVTTPPTLPREFLLELAALLQVREWQAAGVIDCYDSDNLSIDDRIGEAIERCHTDPGAVDDSRRGTDAMIGVLRRWHESCCPAAREHLGCDVALHWDAGIDIEQIVDAFADFLCRHRDMPFVGEGE